MKVKILSVYADEDFNAIWIGEETRNLRANEYLEREIQHFLDQNPMIEIRHIQFTAVPITPRTASDTTNVPVEWMIEKSVLIFYTIST